MLSNEQCKNHQCSLSRRTVRQASRTSSTANSTSSGTWASASLESWWVRLSGDLKTGKCIIFLSERMFFFFLLKVCFPLNRSLGWSSVWCSVVLSETAGRSSKLDPRPPPPPSPKDCIAFRSNVDLCPSSTQGPRKYQYFLSTMVLTRLPWPNIPLFFSEYFYIYLLSQVANILIRLRPFTYPVGTV